MSRNVVLNEANVVAVNFSTAASIPAGRGVLISNLFGVAELDIAATTVAVDNQLRVRGVVQITKTASQAVNIGDGLYWDDTNKNVNKTVGTGKDVGVALSSTGAGAGETTINLLLIPTVRLGTGS